MFLGPTLREINGQVGHPWWEFQWNFNLTKANSDGQDPSCSTSNRSCLCSKPAMWADFYWMRPIFTEGKREFMISLTHTEFASDNLWMDPPPMPQVLLIWF